jgi:hypothetical protein
MILSISYIKQDTDLRLHLGVGFVFGENEPGFADGVDSEESFCPWNIEGEDPFGGVRFVGDDIDEIRSLSGLFKVVGEVTGDAETEGIFEHG